MSTEEKRSGLTLLLAIVAGLALGAWLAVWVTRSASSSLRGEPAAGQIESPELTPAVLQVVQAGPPEPPVRLSPAEFRAAPASHPRVLLVALPTFEPRQRVFLFIRPADVKLCQALQGVELAAYWNGTEPITLCSVGDPAAIGLPGLPVEFAARRSS